MELTDFFGTAAAILASLGGGSFIVLGLSSWLGKVWANRILENEKAAHQEEIDEYKSKLQVELDRLNAIQDKALYISKNQYDNEYRIYQDIWHKLYKCTTATIRLYPGYEAVPVDEDERQKYMEEKYANYVSCFNEFNNSIEENTPFYKAEFYVLFSNLRNCCREMGTIFKYENIKKIYNLSFGAVRNEPMSIEDRKRTLELRKEIVEKREQLSAGIREYLQSLRLSE